MSNISQLKDVPELSFIENLTLQEVIEQMKSLYIEKYRDANGETPTLSESDPIMCLIKAASEICYQGYQYIDIKGKQDVLKYSEGDALDNLVALLGLTRNPAEQATVTMRFTLSAVQASAIGIPAGTRVKTEDDRYFSTIEYAEVKAGELTVDTSAQAEIAGTGSTGILPGVINILVDPIAYVSGAVNTDTSTGGTDTESDDDLTERMFLAPSVYSSAGPKDAYEYYAKAYRNDIADVTATSPSACVVAIYFMLTGGELPKQADLVGMEEYINGEERRPMCDQVKCYAPSEIEYEINVEYWIGYENRKSADTIKANVETAVQEYKDWQRKLGRDINPTELIYRMRAAGAKRVALTTPTDKAVEDTQIAKCKACTVTYGGVEDD